MCDVYQIFLYSTVTFIQIFYSVEKSMSLDLRCKDNEDNPVDWWYMYKPPADVIPFKKAGRNYTYMTPDTAGRWELSDRVLTANSMLQRTLTPMFSKIHKTKIAIVAYESWKGDGIEDNNSGMGILMANEQGGVWIGHTVPRLLDFGKGRLAFPKSEYNNGHLLLCLSIDLSAANELALSIRHTVQQYTRIQVPTGLKAALPFWHFLDGKSCKSCLKNKEPKDVFNFNTRNKTLHVNVMVRKPGDTMCLYKKFAQDNGLVLDVYRHGEKLRPLCGSEFSLRTIDSISMKNVDFVYYINKSLDRATFAVSTAAHWQRLGAAGMHHFWSCISPLDSYKGGLLLCVENYHVWLVFDHLKAVEPEC